MNVHRKVPKVTLKRKMLLYTFAIIILMTILSIYSLTIMNVYKGRIDEMFERNIALAQIEKDLFRVDDELASYLSTKSSSSLNSYMQIEEKLRDGLAETTEGLDNFTEEELLIMDISNMTRSYLSTANQAIQDRRRSNVTAYTRKYEEATVIKLYIESYINELNIRQLDRNADNYVIMTKEIGRSIFLNVVLIFDLILLSILIVLNMSNAMIDPIVRLSHSAGEIAKGRFDTHEIIVETNDELEILARAFNEMKRSIHAYIEELKEKAFTEALLKDQEMENLKMQVSSHPSVPASRNRSYTCYQSSFSGNSEIGSFIPSIMDSLIPGMDIKKRVSVMLLQSSSPTRTAWSPRSPTCRRTSPTQWLPPMSASWPQSRAARRSVSRFPTTSANSLRSVT